jgi:hypothetical protein
MTKKTTNPMCHDLDGSPEQHTIERDTQQIQKERRPILKPEIHVERIRNNRKQHIVTNLSTARSRLAMQSVGISEKILFDEHILRKKRTVRIHTHIKHDAIRPITIVPEGRTDILIASLRDLSPWQLIRWATDLRCKLMLMEHSPSFTRWAPETSIQPSPKAQTQGMFFKGFISTLENIGFRVQWKKQPARYGTTVKNGLFIIARSDGREIRWPKTTRKGEPSRKRRATQ